ncbi:MAG: DUF4157 domain-containing protein [Oscillospiraceae bacterium]|nr:DUF4157 domain-containing protein [Oscillospiraceae bacterium]
MSYTYAARRQVEKALPENESFARRSPALNAPGPGAAWAAEERKGRRVDLPDAMRAKMENAFGADLGAVKLYESRAVADTGAKAIARGPEIAFAPGMLDFTSYGGQALLGHEISHVVSQARGEVTGGGFLSDASLEARADREGAMAAAGQTVAPPTASLSPVTAADAAGPMQAKDKPWRGRKKASAPAASPQVQLPPLPPPAETNMPDFSAEDRARAGAIVDAADADRMRRNASFRAQTERYNAAHPDAPYRASDDQQNRFLGLFLRGSEEENEALFNDVLARGDRAMVPSYIDVIRRVNAADTAKGGNLQELFQYGPGYIRGMQDVENLDDMLRQGRITQEMLAEGGLSREEYGAYSSKRTAFGYAGGLATARLKAMQRGYANAKTIFTGFDASAPSQAPAALAPVLQPSLGPAPAGIAPAPPGRAPNVPGAAQPGTLPRMTVRPNERLLDRFRRK